MTNPEPVTKLATATTIRPMASAAAWATPDRHQEALGAILTGVTVVCAHHHYGDQAGTAGTAPGRHQRRQERFQGGQRGLRVWLNSNRAPNAQNSLRIYQLARKKKANAQWARFAFLSNARQTRKCASPPSPGAVGGLFNPKIPGRAKARAAAGRPAPLARPGAHWCPSLGGAGPSGGRGLPRLVGTQNQPSSPKKSLARNPSFPRLLFLYHLKKAPT